MRILITGRCGQVGHYLTEKLGDDMSVTLLACDKKSLDITNKAEVIRIVKQFEPDIIINAAAYTEVDGAEKNIELAYAVNRDGPQNLAQAAKEFGAAILHISTDYVFDGNKTTPYYESDITRPQNIYGSSKLAGEQAIEQVCDRYIILRTAWVFGEQGNNFVKTMLRLGETKTALNIVGDQYGGPTYAADIAETLIVIAKQIMRRNDVAYGVYHYSGVPHVSWYEFAEEIFHKAIESGLLTRIPSLTKIDTGQYPTPARRPGNSRLYTEKIFNTFSIEASDWKNALNDINAYAEPK